MHTYRKRGTGWEVGFQHPNAAFIQLGPKFGVECEAAAYACFLNGGRYCPDEIGHIFDYSPLEHADDDSTYPRPQGMDYEPEPARK
jgi:hypothetical protein